MFIIDQHASDEKKNYENLLNNLTLTKQPTLIPIKIDIGAIYDKEPRNRAEHKLDSDLFFQEKELVFDIDMKDYDDVRTCCKENNICDKCWKYIICGAKILDKILNTNAKVDITADQIKTDDGSNILTSDLTPKVKVTKPEKPEQPKVDNNVANTVIPQTGSGSFVNFIIAISVISLIVSGIRYYLLYRKDVK